jgi:hypothetical protein
MRLIRQDRSSLQRSRKNLRLIALVVNAALPALANLPALIGMAQPCSRWGRCELYLKDSDAKRIQLAYS